MRVSIKQPPFSGALAKQLGFDFLAVTYCYMALLWLENQFNSKLGVALVRCYFFGSTLRRTYFSGQSCCSSDRICSRL
ncbi:hypothetical protein HETIRDRAFT_164197 [Heterobasidion irregulare TC 32-1]|uniref:Uncharacterized protein n=1 Tax=Heterobasidion irregulare (strain TC 32-1) TaxID=747525 RepID=W4JXL5_HETIT|nr:uncharacterized protein HETIRDRAFT_164197 [Heterobasidion irregulare TC 32-1]ETW78219.1 hypothetical protein HETIRDRAFT_164197 [Heterobasidion irregulare TC 32-1]